MHAHHIYRTDGLRLRRKRVEERQDFFFIWYRNVQAAQFRHVVQQLRQRADAV